METVSSSKTNVDKSEIDNFYASVPMDDLELLVGPVVAQSRSNSPVNGVQDSATESVSGTTFMLFYAKEVRWQRARSC